MRRRAAPRSVARSARPVHHPPDRGRSSRSAEVLPQRLPCRGHIHLGEGVDGVALSPDGGAGSRHLPLGREGNRAVGGLVVPGPLLAEYRWPVSGSARCHVRKRILSLVMALSVSVPVACGADPSPALSPEVSFRTDFPDTLHSIDLDYGAHARAEPQLQAHTSGKPRRPGPPVRPAACAPPGRGSHVACSRRPRRSGSRTSRRAPWLE